MQLFASELSQNELKGRFTPPKAPVSEYLAKTVDSASRCQQHAPILSLSHTLTGHDEVLQVLDLALGTVDLDRAIVAVNANAR